MSSAWGRWDTKSGDLACMQILQSLIRMTAHVHSSIAKIYGAKIPVYILVLTLIVFQDCKLDVIITRHVLTGQLTPPPPALYHGQQLCKVLSQSKLPVEVYGPETNFCYVWTVTLTLGIWPGVKVMIPLCLISSRSNMLVRSYGSDKDLDYVFTVTLTFEISPWANVMTHPWVFDNNCVKYYPDPTWQWRVMARTPILRYVCTVNLTIWPWVKVMTHPRVMDNNCVKYYPDPTKG